MPGIHTPCFVRLCNCTSHNIYGRPYITIFCTAIEYKRQHVLLTNMEGNANILVKHVCINCIDIFLRSLDRIESLRQEVFIPHEWY